MIDGRYNVSEIMRDAWKKVRFYQAPKEMFGFYLREVWIDAKREMERWQWENHPSIAKAEILNKLMPCRSGFIVPAAGSDYRYRDSSWRIN